MGLGGERRWEGMGREPGGGGGGRKDQSWKTRESVEETWGTLLLGRECEPGEEEMVWGFERRRRVVKAAYNTS